LAALKNGADGFPDAKRIYRNFAETTLNAKRDRVGPWIGTANRKFAAAVGMQLRGRFGIPGHDWNKTLTYDVVNKILSDIDATFAPIKSGA
jgi:hypothetical protein